MSLLPTTAGVELELNNQAGINHDIVELRAKLERFTGWVVKTDGSCGDRGAGPEVISPIMRTEADLHKVDEVCHELTRLGYEVTPKCGFHVHIGVSALTAVQRDRFIQLLHQFENVFFKLAPGRRATRWCKEIPANYIEAVRRGAGWQAWTDRYHWVNGCAFSRHTTCEIRLMSGSLNPRQVVGWVNLLLHLYDVCRKGVLAGELSWVKEASDSDATLRKLMTVARLTAEDELDDFNPDERLRVGLARTYLLQRWEDVQNDVVSIRQERKRRLHAAWKGQEKFEPVFAKPTVTM